MKINKQNDFPHDDFGFLDWKYKKHLPQLVLGVVQYPPQYRKYDFKEPEKFLKIEHQTAGHACSRVFIEGMLLDPTKEMLKLMIELDDVWLDSCVGMLRTELDSIVKYREQLNKFGLDCNNSYTLFQEGAYPIDCSSENLKQICDDDIPENLDDLINFEDKTSELMGSLNRWTILVLGHNCD